MNRSPFETSSNRMVPETDLDVMSDLLTVVDSYEKLEIVVHLYRVRFRMERSSALGRSLSLSPRSVAEALAALLRAGVIRTSNSDDDAGWWFDPNSGWATSVEVLVELYEMDRNELLGFMKDSALRATRSQDARPTVLWFARRGRDRTPPASN